MVGIKNDLPFKTFNQGFTYDVLDKYIRTGKIDNLEIKNKIDTMHEKNLFKLQLMPSFNYKERD